MLCGDIYYGKKKTFRKQENAVKKRREASW